MSSLWGFSTNASTSSYLHRVDIDTDVVDVLSVLHECLPQIPPRYLSRDKSVGIGSLFHVRREIYDEQNDPPLQYYVAVKYIRVDQKAEIRRQASRALLRELRAIMHPRLRGHPHIISAFGYGWTESISEDSNLFLVMEYANFGTLSDLLQATNLQRSITVPERHHLVLETACGLQALHECGIIHGDLKASNVLVFSRSFPLGYTSDVQDIAWAVKIADFGSSISQIEADQRVFRYTGTAVYNAPEIESTVTSGFTNSGSFIQYKSADVYSFGLLLWEVMKTGRFYMDCIDNQGRAIKQRDRLEFLKKIHETSDDAMLETALRSLEDVRIDILDLGLRDIWESISTVLSYCLQKPFAARKSATMVYEKLRSCTSGDKATIVYSLPRMRSAPPRIVELAGRDVGGYTRLTVATKQLTKAGPDGQTFRTVDRDRSSKIESRLIPFRGMASQDIAEGNDVLNVTMKLHRADLSPRPPRNIQKQMVANWTVQSGQSEDEGIRSEAYMELSASHLLGFGVEQDLTKSLNLLREARRGSKIARRIFQQVSKALSSDGLSAGDVNGAESYFQGRLIRMPSPVLITLDRFATPQVQSHVHRTSTTSTSAILLSLIEQELSKDKASPKVLDMDVLEDLWQKHAQHSLAQKDISEALGDACKTGSFEIASILARLCVKYIGPHGGPTPLHWLVMFPMEQAASMAKLLIQGHGDDQDTSISARFCRLMRTHSPDITRPYVGICHNLVNSQTTCSVYLPEHCLELVGAPLHWAVRCNNFELVRLLLEYGANPDLRCKVSSRLPGEPRSIIPLNYNSLDIALEYHLFGIAELLLEYAKKRGARIEIGASLLARTTTTWSRYVIHGSSYRLAFRRTIEVLIDYGWDLTRPDYFDEIPLLVALGNNAEERYIVEDLIRHFDPSRQPARMGDAELATHIVTHSDSEFASSPWKMERMMPFIKDLNKMDERGRNALHYCSLLGNAVLADVLIGTGRVDINAVSSSTDRSTPLRSAAEFGKVDVVQLLLERGADIDFPNTNEEKPPLERAIMNRQYETASLLIKHGASLDFGLSEGFAPRNSVLHAACINGSARPPMVKRLLEDHPRLRAKAVINRAQRLPSTNMTHMSPLWLAVYYADLESAEALLEHGADPDLFNTNFDINIPTELCDNVDIFQRSVKLQSHENMVTARGLVDHILKRAINYPLDKGQLQVALEWRSELMRGVAFRTEQNKGRNKALSSQTGILAAFDSRLDEIQTEKQEPAVRAFIARLEEIKRLMEQHAPRVQQTDLVNMKLQRT